MEQVVAAAAWAPSWTNTQTARYIVLESRELIEKLADDCVIGFKYNTATLKAAAAVVANCLPAEPANSLPAEPIGKAISQEADANQNYDELTFHIQ